jgi:hypothetical protein
MLFWTANRTTDRTASFLARQGAGKTHVRQFLLRLFLTYKFRDDPARNQAQANSGFDVLDFAFIERGQFEGTDLVRSHICGMAQAMKANVPFRPININAQVRLCVLRTHFLYAGQSQR